MTGYTVHTGSSKKFSDGWDQIFGSPKEKKSGSKKSGKKKSTKASSAKSKSKKKKKSK